MLDGFFHFLDRVGVMALLAEAHGIGIERELVPPTYRTVLLYELKTLFGIDSMHGMPALLLSDAARMPLVGFKAQYVRRWPLVSDAPNTTQPRHAPSVP